MKIEWRNETLYVNNSAIGFKSAHVKNSYLIYFDIQEILKIENKISYFSKKEIEKYGITYAKLKAFL